MSGGAHGGRLVLLALVAAMAARAAGVTPELQKRVRGATFEVVLKKPERDPLGYEKPLPLELLPYIERTDAYRSIGTAFALGSNTYVTAGHVLVAGIASQYGAPGLRGADGRVHPIGRILKFSAHEDYAVFALADDPAPAPLEANREPQLDDPVLAVGNALGEGIVIRDGLYTSATPEEQDGRWKWIRFSAAASPGNSGGPLLDAAGRVIGIVIGKSPNENLNYSLPIGRVLDGPASAGFELRALQGLPFLRGTRTYLLQDGFALPKGWPDFVQAYLGVMERHGELARAELLGAYADRMFPKGKGVEDLLYAADAAYFPRVITQDSDDRWSAQEPGYARTDLGGDGYVAVASQAQRGFTLLRLHRPGNAADPGWYADSKGFMDLALKGLGIARQVGSDAVRVTSLGPAASDTAFVDHYGRRWQLRSWALPYLDAHVVALLLPTPDGYAGLVQMSNGVALTETRRRLQLLADLFDVSYWGTLAQWRAFLVRRELLPQALAGVRLGPAAQGGWRLETPRFGIDLAPRLMAADERSMIGLQMAYEPDGERARWAVGGAAWYQDEAEKTWLSVERQLHPPPAARRELREHWDDLVGHHSPYNGSPSREGANAWSVQDVIDVPARKAGSVADEVIYALRVHTENRPQMQDVVDMQQRAREAVHVLERGERERAAAIGADTGADAGVGAGGQGAAAAANPAVVDAYLRTIDQSLAGIDAYVAWIGEHSGSGPADFRGRRLADDLHEYVVAGDTRARLRELHARFEAAERAGHRDQLVPIGTDIQVAMERLRAGMQMFETYWSGAEQLGALDASWPAFLQRNHLPPDESQSESVIQLRQRLSAALHAGAASIEVEALAGQLQAAYLEERSARYGRIRALVPPQGTDYRERTGPCPAPVAPPAARGEHPARVNATRGVEEYYPASSLRNGEVGTVMLAVRIDAGGCALGVGLRVSSGFPDLDAAALRWIQEAATFTPASQNGKAHESVKDLTIRFKMDASESNGVPVLQAVGP